MSGESKVNRSYVAKIIELYGTIFKRMASSLMIQLWTTKELIWDLSHHLRNFITFLGRLGLKLAQIVLLI